MNGHNRETGILGEPDAGRATESAGPGDRSGNDSGSNNSGGSGGDDVWVTLGHTASMSPDERARRGLTPPEELPTGVPAPSLEREAVATTGAASLAAAEASAARAAAALPVEDSTRYELEGVHARGGLGRVVRAHDRLLRRTVAIKELLQRTPSAQARFMREALITARLQHPGIVPVHEAGRWPSGDPYYSMKLVSGRTLKEMIQERKGLDERLALLPHVLAVAEAIAYAHSQGVVHRDVKPANVVVGDFGETVVVDWGLAKDLAVDLAARAGEGDTAVDAADLASGTEPNATAVGHVMGTPAYMAPEQARGESIDARADVYSLGALLYELLAGEPPHTGDSADKILLSALTASPVPIELRQPGAPPDLVAIVHKAMARRPADRYRSAIELAEDVRRFQTGQLVTARQYSTRTLVRRWIARHRGVVVVAAAAAAALAITGGVAFQRVVAQRNLAESRSAEAFHAEQVAREKQNELIFLQAQSWLARDPTAAVAWLKLYPAGGPRAERVGAIVDEAMDLGVSRHILRLPAWPAWVGFTGDGSAAIGVLKTGEIIRWDVASGAPTSLGRHHETVNAVSMSPDGAVLAVGGLGGAIELFAPDGRSAPRRLPSQADAVGMLGFSADGRRLLSVSDDRAVRLWDVASAGEPGQAPILAIDGAPITGAALGNDGETVFLAMMSGEVERVSVADGSRRHVAHLDKPAYGLSPSPDGKMLAALFGEWAQSIALVDVASGDVTALDIANVKGSFGFSPTGKLLVAGSSDGTIYLHDVESGTDRELHGHEDDIYHLVFSADESMLLSASDDATARLWNLRTGSVRVLRGHEDDVFFAALTPDAGMVATASFDASIRLWQLDGAHEVSQVLGRIGEFAGATRSLLTEDGGIVLTANESERHSWNLATGERHSTKSEWPGMRDPRYRLLAYPALDLRTRRYVVPREEGVIEIWDLVRGESTEIGTGDGVITAVALSVDGRTLVTGRDDGRVEVWDTAGGDDAEPRLLARDLVARGAALSPDGKRVALGLDDRLELLDLASGARLGAIELDPVRAPSRVQRQLRFSPDGRSLAAWNKTSSSITLWDVNRGRVAHVDIGGGQGLTWLAFSPDSSRLALAVSDRSVRVVDAATGQTRLLTGHRDLVHQVAWSPDGKKIASASYDRTIRLWDPDTGRVLRVLRGHGKSVDAVAFSPDGATLTSASGDGTVRRWNLSRLPDDRAEAVPLRLAAATSAVIGRGERAETPAPARAGPAGPAAAAARAPRL